MEVTKEMREAGEKVFWNAWASSHKTAIGSFNIGLDAAFALVPKQAPNELIKRIAKVEADLENAERMYVAMRDRCAHVENDLAKAEATVGVVPEPSTAAPESAAPQTDAELVEELCEAQFKKGAATNIRSVLSRLASAKERTSLRDACQVLENARQQAGKERRK